LDRTLFRRLAGAFSADGIDRFRARFGDEHKRASFKAEGGAELSGEVFLVGVGEQFVAIDEEEEGGWGLLRLGGVEELQEMPVASDGLAAFDSLLKGAIEESGGDSLAGLSGDVANGFEEAVQVNAGGGGGKDDGGVIEEEEGFLNPAAEIGEGRHGLGIMTRGTAWAGRLLALGFVNGVLKQVPFVDDKDARFGFGRDLGRDFFVLFKDAGFGVKDQDGDVAAGNGGFGAFDTVELDGVMNAPFLADPGRVDQEVWLSDPIGFDLERHVDRIASGAGDGTYNDTSGLGEGINDGRLADIGPADDGKSKRFLAAGAGAGTGGRRVFCRGNRRFGGEQRDGGIHEIVDAPFVDRTDREDSIETEFGEIGDGIGLACGIDLVGGDDDRFSALPQAAGDFAVEGHDAFASIDDEEDGVSGLDGEADLFQGGLDDGIADFLAPEQTDTACIHEGKGAPAPLGFRADAVAGDAGLIVNDGDATPDEAIEECRFSHVRASNDGYEGRHGIRMLERAGEGK
jgi:hypothetical protein